MLRRDLLCAGLMGAALSVSGIGASAQTADGPGPNLVLEVAGAHPGRIVIDLFPDVAPQHVKRIEQLVADHAYDGVVFHRVDRRFHGADG
jgi:Peptidyl-prolyl cis-trans isomerase (rotamase) - cyclophilin family